MFPDTRKGGVWLYNGKHFQETKISYGFYKTDLKIRAKSLKKNIWEFLARLEGKTPLIPIG